MALHSYIGSFIAAALLCCAAGAHAALVQPPEPDTRPGTTEVGGVHLPAGAFDVTGAALSVTTISFDDSAGLMDLDSRFLGMSYDDGFGMATAPAGFIESDPQGQGRPDSGALDAPLAEPASLGLIGAGLALAGWTRHRRLKDAA